MKKRDVQGVEVHEVVDSLPSDHIWKQQGEHWKLREPILEEFGPSS